MKTLILLAAVLIAPMAQASERLMVRSANGDTLIVARPNSETWSLTVDQDSCGSVSRLAGRMIIGEYDSLPSEMGAYLTLPASFNECRIISAERL